MVGGGEQAGDLMVGGSVSSWLDLKETSLLYQAIRPVHRQRLLPFEQGQPQVICFRRRADRGIVPSAFFLRPVSELRVPEWKRQLLSIEEDFAAVQKPI